MSKIKKQNKKSKKKKHSDLSQKAVSTTESIGKLKFWNSSRFHKLALPLLAFVLYANTLTHDYTQDDAIVIYDNMFTQQGLSGIPGILSNDTFFGFFKEEGKAKLVAGGRYRPFTQIMYALEWQLFGRNPLIGHLINVLLYALLGLMLYKMLSLMILGEDKEQPKNRSTRLFIFIACLLYIAHPIHTEAVANIKGRDEIMTLLGGVTAIWASFKYYHSRAIKWNLIALVSFFVALMSKENAITFLAVVPLSYMLFRKLNFFKTFSYLWPFVLSTIIFLAIRTAVLGLDFGDESIELMNNPFLKLSGTSWIPFTGAEKMATILFTLGKYLWLLLFPHPLCHDYYPRAIEIMTFSDWQVLLSLVVYAVMVVGAFVLWKKDRYISFGIFFFVITLSIVSNIVFPIGTNMSERFMFMPSIGIMLVLARILSKYLKNETILMAATAFFLAGFAMKTITRNMVWKDDFTLFTTDVKTNSKSAKLLNAAGGALTVEAAKLGDGPQQTKMLTQALGYLNDAIEVHPTYRNAYLLKGNALFYLEKYEESIATYDRVLQLYPNFNDALKNLPIVLRDAGKYVGQHKNDIPRSSKYLSRSYELNPKDPETLRLLGIVNGMQGDHDKAIFYFEKAVEYNPNSAMAYVNLGTAYKGKGDAVKAAEYYNRARELDPNALDSLQGN